MWKSALLLICLGGYCSAGPVGPKRNMPIMQKEDEPAIMESEDATPARRPVPAAGGMMVMSTLTLPSNATSIRADITDGFSCANRSYGYYADVENDCQIFHVCLPVTYADGKENTFRWSFICPEDTVFSQESFTCMRREDMTIDCEESFKYYELNRNFGMVEEEKENKRNPSSSSSHIAMHAANDDQESAMSANMEQQQLQLDEDQHVDGAVTVGSISAAIQPTMKPKEKPAATFQVPAATQPVKKKQKPAATSAPTAIQPTSQKEKPAKTPKPNRRKPTQNIHSQKRPTISQPQRKTPQATPATPEVTTTPSVPEQDVKPTSQRFTKRPTMSSALKEKVQPQSLKAESTPIRVELYSPKRKRPTVLNKKDATTSKPDEVPATDEVAARPTTQAGDKAETIVSSAAAAENSQADTQSQASETAVVYVKPFHRPEVESQIAKDKKTSVKPTEAMKVETPTVPIEAFEEIPAVIAEFEEGKPASSSDEQIINETESSKPTASERDHLETAEVALSVKVKGPAIFEENTEEDAESSPTLEELEAAKPADAVEIVPASPEMENHDPIVQQMFGETDAHKQALGGFKPVDPAMAAEAEALIAGFLNTLMKTDTKPIHSGEVIDETPDLSGGNQDTSIKAEEDTEKVENKKPLENENSESSMPKDQAQTPTAEVAAVQMPQNAASMTSTMMMMNHFPAEMYQIPVKVIQSPIEEMPSVPQAITEKTEEKLAEDQPKEPTDETDGYKPLSIDDIVELVKERLDQVPAAEKGTPMELALQQQNTEQTSQSPFTEEELLAPPQPFQEEIVMPIYHRLTELGESDGMPEKTKAETELQMHQNDNKDKKEEISKTESIAVKIEARNKPSHRFFGARSLKDAKIDPRKRRFLFRADVS